MPCINCQQEVTGKFCQNCGQRTNVKRISLKEAWFDFWSRVYGFDGMFPRTLRDLTIQPGFAAKKFIEGNRVLYYGPVGYFFLMITLYILTISILNIDLFELAKVINPYTELKDGSGQEQFNRGLMGWIRDNQRIVSFMFIPFYVFWTKLFFRKSNYNFLEHAVMVLYTQGHFQWLSILFLFVFKWTGYYPDVVLFTTLSVIYFCFACVQLYKMYKPIGAILRGVLVQLMFWLSLFLVVSILTTIALLINPELLEQIRPSNN
ncbi:MAG: DUF3667 domain-containing protein [Cyclobacteriaceae bacterium]|nr:DUF3667 domain-containing protein [Cyclobacteriaceae bacterium]